MDFGINPKFQYYKLDIICDLGGKKKIQNFIFTMKQYTDKKQAKQFFKQFRFKNIILGDSRPHPRTTKRAEQVVMTKKST